MLFGMKVKKYKVVGFSDKGKQRLSKIAVWKTEMHKIEFPALGVSDQVFGLVSDDRVYLPKYLASFNIENLEISKSQEIEDDEANRIGWRDDQQTEWMADNQTP